MRGLPLAWAAATLASAGLAACGPGEEGPLMAAGEDCMTCHGGGEGPVWTVAGTVYGSPQGGGIHGVKVQLVDAGGKVVEAWSNDAGNFYSAESFTPPYTVTLLRAGRSITGSPNAVNEAHLVTAACNGCHVGTARLVSP